MRQNGRSSFALFGTLLIVSVVLSLAGCTDPPEPITSYEVPKHELIQVPLAPEPSPANYEPIKDPTDRILGAMIFVGDVAWYFKGKAAIKAYPEDASEQFDKLLTTVKFDDPKKPSWELSEQWTEKPGQGMRAAELVLGDVVFSVIKLPITDPNERKYLLSNINRWRDQVKLGPISSAQLANESHKITTADGNDATVVSLLGKSNDSAMPPMMRQAAGSGAAQKPIAPSGSSGAGSQAGVAGSSRLSSEPPEAWEQQKAGMMQEEKYLVSDDDGSAVVSVSIAGGAVIPNVNRWRGQIGLPAIEKEEEVNAEPIKVSETDSLLIRLIGEKQSIIVAMVPQTATGRVWFFKMQGDTSVVEKTAESFASYLSTVKLK